jgi:hypothetical protein
MWWKSKTAIMKLHHRYEHSTVRWMYNHFLAPILSPVNFTNEKILWQKNTSADTQLSLLYRNL